MRRVFRGADLPVPLPLVESALIDRVSQRLAAVLAGIDGHPTRLAQGSWRPSWRSPDEDWADAERVELEDDLAGVDAPADNDNGGGR